MMAMQQPIGDVPARCRERKLPLAPNANKRVALQAFDGHGDGRRRHIGPAGECGGNNRLSLAFRFSNGFEIVLLGDGNFHANPDCIPRKEYEEHSAASPQMWGGFVTCGRLSIGLPKLSRDQQQADFQSAAGYHPAPQTKVLEKTVATSGTSTAPAPLLLLISRSPGL